MNAGLIEVDEFDQIVYCKAEGNYTRIYFLKRSVITTKVLRCFESILPPENFLRIHKSYLVNINYISSLTMHNSVRLKTNEEIPIARRRKSQIMKDLARKKLIIKTI